MYEQPALKTWAIFHGDRDANIAKQFSSTMDECLKQFGYEGSAQPAVFPVRGGMNPESWKKEIKSKLNNNVQAVVLLVPGQKNKSPIYDEVKKLLLSECPVPSQAVLTNTISKGKNLRSIVNKILI